MKQTDQTNASCSLTQQVRSCFLRQTLGPNRRQQVGIHLLNALRPMDGFFWFSDAALQNESLVSQEEPTVVFPPRRLLCLALSETHSGVGVSMFAKKKHLSLYKVKAYSAVWHGTRSFCWGGPQTKELPLQMVGSTLTLGYLDSSLHSPSTKPKGASS